MTWTILAGALALVVAVVVARLVGRVLKDRPRWWYWAANAVVAAVAMGLLMASTLWSDRILWGVGLGIGFGGIAGLRYGIKDLFTVRTGSRS